ncbi:MAG: hypothetical protein RLZZ24_1354, partial [Pseudomonadota bacterium]
MDWLRTVTSHQLLRPVMFSVAFVF